MPYRWEVDSTMEIYRSVPAKRYVIATLGGYFPVLTRLQDGSLFVVYRTGDFHVGERGRLETSVSLDGGETWSAGQPVTHGGPDARNPALIQTSDGTILISYIRAAYRNGEFIRNDGYDTVYLVRSEDGGETWSEPIVVDTSGIDSIQYSPFGRMVELPDGTILMNLYVGDRDGGEMTSWVIRSRDGGRTWSDPSVVQQGGDETALIRLSSGKLLVAVRNTPAERGGPYLNVTESTDGGYTWSGPQRVTGLTQIPGDLLQLGNGNVLLTFGHRTSPFGVHALVSRDRGKTWDRDNQITLVADCVRADCGYPSSVRLDDGTIFTAYYAYESSGPFTHGVPQYGMFMGAHAAGVKYKEADLP